MNANILYLVESLDQAVVADSPENICKNVRSVLTDCIAKYPDLLPKNFIQPSSGSYARRLLYKCPRDLYSIVIMVWDQSQGTELHDHSGKWCVEGVYQGMVQVKSYKMTGKNNKGHYEFKYQGDIVQGAGRAGALIPPFEYHILSNPFEEVAVTIHVYNGEMTSSHAFYSVGHDEYRRELERLSYTN